MIWRSAAETLLVRAAAGGACRFVAELGMDTDAHVMAGAPERLVVQVIVSDDGAVTWDVVQVNKRPTRCDHINIISQ
jgi:hypothetical protein